MPAHSPVPARRSPTRRRSIRRRACLALATGLAAAAVAAQTALAGAASAVSANWSGYAVTGTTFRSVSGSWVAAGRELHELDGDHDRVGLLGRTRRRQLLLAGPRADRDRGRLPRGRHRSLLRLVRARAGLVGPGQAGGGGGRPDRRLGPGERPERHRQAPQPDDRQLVPKDAEHGRPGYLLGRVDRRGSGHVEPRRREDPAPDRLRHRATSRARPRPRAAATRAPSPTPPGRRPASCSARAAVAAAPAPSGRLPPTRSAAPRRSRPRCSPAAPPSR